ncbi:MAG: c-type cytochrome, partial [Candidatus Omnitrophica bacterium]|nr:c-type cytochrome [Candidatus Omnitrophota bacterium]
PETSESFSESLLHGLAEGWPRGVAPAMKHADFQWLSQLLESLTLENQVRLFALLDKWESKDPFIRELDQLKRNLESKVANTNLNDEDRIRSADLLMEVSDSPESIEALSKTISTVESPDYVRGVLRALATSQLHESGEVILSLWPDLGPSAQTTALDSLLRRHDWTLLLLEAFDTGKVQPTLLSLVQRKTLTEHKDLEISSRAKDLYESTPDSETSAQRKEVMGKILAIAPGSGDLEHGKSVFEKNCAVCHTLDGTGGELGPDLTGVGANDRSAILMDILDPNRSVEGVYFQWHVTTEDDFTYSGRLLNETASAVEILEPNGNRNTIPRKEIVDMRMSSLSVMPEGFELLPEEDLVSLVDYLKTRVVGESE